MNEIKPVRDLVEAAVAPIKDAIYQNSKKSLEGAVLKLRTELEACGWDRERYAPYPKSTMSRVVYKVTMAKYNWVRAWTTPADPTVRRFVFDSAPDVVVIPDPSAKIDRMAKEEAKATFESYCRKLVAKITEAGIKEAVTVTYSGGASPWSRSTIEVVMDSGSRASWTTSVIMNRSIYGKLFNQFPTRRNIA
jgi:hypothetical protein